MYYGLEDVEKALACSFCAKKLAETVKFIPECGNFICGRCYAELSEGDDEEDPRKYKCLACEEDHTLPESGLADCKQLQKVLKLKPAEKPLNENAKKLKALIKEVVDQMEKLAAFDGKEVVNEYCDRLKLEVNEAVASAVKHLGAIERELLKQIGEYRNKCLENLSTLSEDQTAPRVGHDDEETIKSLAAMRKEISEFNAEWSDYFSRMEALASESHIEAALIRTDRFKAEMKSLEQAMKKQSLLDRSLIFKGNLKFLQRWNHIREIETLHSLSMRVQDTASLTMKGHSDWIRQIVFLSDDRLVSCSDEKIIKIWDLQNGKELFELRGHTDWVGSLAVLPSGQLASGSSDHTIKIWDLDERKVIRTIEGHDDYVASLCVLKNGSLASFSDDEAIDIWDLSSHENSPAQSIRCSENSSYTFLGLLSNGFLIASCWDDEESNANPGECLLRVWNLNEAAQPVKSVPTGFKDIECMLVLSSDHVALGTENGTIKIVDLNDDTLTRIKEEAHEESVNSFAQHSNGNMISAGVESSEINTIKVWDVGLDLSLLQTIITDHSNCIGSLAISPNGNFLASASNDHTIKIWPITCE